MILRYEISRNARLRSPLKRRKHTSSCCSPRIILSPVNLRSGLYFTLNPGFENGSHVSPWQRAARDCRPRASVTTAVRYRPVFPGVFPPGNAQLQTQFMELL
ncbi:hypothetical protein E2C01_016524 [Portunus trituberculatus]|uniref:Uncharacterized protein n=1 Tax=Portunus trituberculatus TaxID=210409 RepID=A0A5B7DQH0_PORTR|nr:hypothetical protein [Portunus trituberculatus]